jgi:hypothetical protein
LYYILTVPTCTIVCFVRKGTVANDVQVPLLLPEMKFDVTFRNHRFRYS